MARKPERVIALEEAILNAVEQIDTANPNRVGLLDCFDNVRMILAQAYDEDGSDFDADLAEKMGFELIDEDDEQDNETDEEDDETDEED